MSRIFSKVYELGEGKTLVVDQNGINGDKTALCFARFNEDKIKIIKKPTHRTKRRYRRIY